MRGTVQSRNRGFGNGWWVRRTDGQRPGGRDVLLYYDDIPSGFALNPGDVIEFDNVPDEQAGPGREKAQNVRLVARGQQYGGRQHGEQTMNILPIIDRVLGAFQDGFDLGAARPAPIVPKPDRQSERARASGDEAVAKGRGARHKAVGHAEEIRAGGEADRARSSGHAEETRAAGEVINRQLEVLRDYAVHLHGRPDDPNLAVVRVIAGFDPNGEHASANAHGVVDIYHAVNEPATVGQAIRRSLSRMRIPSGNGVAAVIKWIVIGFILLIITGGLFGCSPGEARRDILKAVSEEQVREHQFKMACLEKDRVSCVGITQVPQPQVVQPATAGPASKPAHRPTPAPAVKDRLVEIADIRFDSEADTMIDRYGVARVVPFDKSRSGIRFEIYEPVTPLFTEWEFRSPWPRPQTLQITFVLERCENDPPAGMPPQQCTPYAQETLQILFDDSKEQIPVAFGDVEEGNYRLRALYADGTEVKCGPGTKCPAYFSIVDPPLYGRVNTAPEGLRSPGVFFYAHKNVKAPDNLAVAGGLVFVIWRSGALLRRGGWPRHARLPNGPDQPWRSELCAPSSHCAPGRCVHQPLLDLGNWLQCNRGQFLGRGASCPP